MLSAISNDQSKVLDYIKQELIGPKNGDKEQLSDINPVDMYLMGMIHPINDNENIPVDSDDQIEGFFQNKPPSFGLSFYLGGGGEFILNVSCAQYMERRVLSREFLK